VRSTRQAPLYNLARENFLGSLDFIQKFCSFCFDFASCIAMENALKSHCSAKHSSGKILQFIENPQKLQNFSLTQLLSFTVLGVT